MTTPAQRRPLDGRRVAHRYGHDRIEAPLYGAFVQQPPMLLTSLHLADISRLPYMYGGAK